MVNPVQTWASNGIPTNAHFLFQHELATSSLLVLWLSREPAHPRLFPWAPSHGHPLALPMGAKGIHGSPWVRNGWSKMLTNIPAGADGGRPWAPHVLAANRKFDTLLGCS